MVVEFIKAELGWFRGGSQVDHHRPVALNRQLEAVTWRHRPRRVSR
jgi:hypothetical protein